MIKKILVGIDGGGTKSTVRVETVEGQLLGQIISGPANIRISVAAAWHSILTALDQILGLQFAEVELYAAMGLAGCEIKEAYDKFITTPHPFKQLHVTSDAHIACLGAHHGDDGAILVIGTGVVGFQVYKDKITKVSGWGFPHDDLGGGAWLGLEAMKLTLQHLDGRKKKSELAQKIFHHFSDDQTRMVTWANQANSTAFAELAPFVIQAAQAQDSMAIALLQTAADALNDVHQALGMTNLKCSLLGGIAPFIKDYLPIALKAQLVPCQMSPDAGAVLLARNNYVRLHHSRHADLIR